MSCRTAAADTPSQVQIHTVAGGGSCSGAMISGGPCDGLPATSVPIGNLVSVSAMPNGGFLYVDAANDLVREVSATGAVTTVAGTNYLAPGTGIFPSTTDVENVPATQSGLDHPVGVAALPTGGFLITEAAGSRVRMVNPQGIITTVAGCAATATSGSDPTQPDNPHPGEGSCPGSNNPGSPTGQELNYPSDAEPTAGGNVLIADTYNCRVMMLTPGASSSILTRVAGGGGGCSSPSGCVDSSSACNGQVAGNVALDLPYSVAELRPGGAYLVGEEGSDAVREISSQSLTGTFTTVVGQPGSPGYSGDGGPAVLARIGGGSAGFGDQVAATVGGGFLFTDPFNEVVREVSPAGVISTLAGTGQASFSGDGGPPTLAALDNPVSVSPMFSGNVVIGVQGDGVVREITQPPATAIALLPPSPNGANGWYVTAPTVSVTANQHWSLIACEVDPVTAPSVFAAIAPGCPYSPLPTQLAVNGAHTVWASSANLFGDDANPISKSFKVDIGPPLITCPHEPVFPFGAPHAAVTGRLSDSVSGPTSVSVTAKAAVSSLGTHELVLRGRNNAGTSGHARCKYYVAPIFLSPAPRLSWAARVKVDGTVIRRLLVDDVPTGATVRAVCHGKGCRVLAPRRLKLVTCAGCATKGARSADAGPLLRRGTLPAGTRISISVTRYGAIGSFLGLTVRAKERPAHYGSCLRPGATTPSLRRCMPKLPY